MFQTYFLLKPGVDHLAFRSKIKEAGAKYIKPELNVWLDMQCLKDVYLHSEDLGNNRTVSGDLKKIRVFIVIGILILLIAAFNLALPVSFVAMLLLLPAVNRLFNANLTFSFHEQWSAVLGFVVLCIITGILSGSYLALYLARLNPVAILRNKISFSGKSALFYRILVVLQVVIFIGLLSASGLIFYQINHVEKMDMGLDRNNLVIVYADRDKIPNSLNYVEEVRKSPLVMNWA